MMNQTPTRREAQLDPRRVEKLIRHGMTELEKAAMAFRSEGGRTHFARLSPGALVSRARGVLRKHPADSEERFAEYIEAVIRSEHDAYMAAERARRYAT